MASKRSKRRKRRRRNAARGVVDFRDRNRRGGPTGGRIPIRAAAFGGVKSVITRAIIRSPIGKKALTVARQRISKIPGVGGLFGRTRAAARPAGLISARTGRELAVRPSSSVAKRVAIAGGKVAAGGAAFELGSTVFANIRGGGDVARRIAKGLGSGGGSSRARAVPFTPGGIVPMDSITHTWVANGVPFAQLADGRVMVRRKNGSIKTFRRPRPIVLGRNPGVRDLVRADKKIDALLKLVKKRFPARRTAAPRHSQAHN